MSEDTCPLCHTYTLPIPLTIHWIECSICSKWFHNHCLNLSNSQVKFISEYHCPNCCYLNGPSKLKRTSGRTKRSIDYVALDNGDVHSITLDQHPHLMDFISWENPKGTIINEKYGYELMEKNFKLNVPIKIPFAKNDGFGMIIPENFNIDLLVENLGENYPIEIMDVLTQNSLTKNWNLGKWRDYFKKDKKDRERILNVLSLEISHCKIGKLIKRPTFVENVDLVDKIWSLLLNEKNESTKPKVTKYCLMGVENSFTDFHLDFAGTSVYYTIIKGSKQFIFFPPTKLNLNKYTKWIKNLNEMANSFLGNLGLEKGIKINLEKGDSLIIPSGWIHAVYTPEDSIVIGGNFLTSFNIPEQLKIIDIEIETKVEKKFKFPNFNKLMWLTGVYLIKNKNNNNNNNDNDNDIDYEGKIELIKFLKNQMMRLESNDKKVRKEVKESIPWEYVGKVDEFINKLEKLVNEWEKKEEAKEDEFNIKVEKYNNNIGIFAQKRINMDESINVKKKVKQ